MNSAIATDNLRTSVEVPRLVLPRQCDEVLEWDDEGERPVKRCTKQAKWWNPEPHRESVKALCDVCREIRFRLFGWWKTKHINASS